MSWGLIAQFRALLKPKPTPQSVATEVVSAGLLPAAPTHIAMGVVAEAPRRQKAELGIQGHAPIVTVTKYRHGNRCKCGTRVWRGEFHLCIYNAEHHVGHLNAEQCAELMRQLETLGTKVIPFKPRAKRKRA